MDAERWEQVQALFFAALDRDPEAWGAFLDEALDRLAAMNERASQVIQYRFYSGLTLDETAEVLGVSVKTVQRDWLSARAWLRKEVVADLGL